MKKFSSKPGKQRKKLHTAPLHALTKRLSAPLSPDLSERYGRRSLPVRNGDEVRVERGDYAGVEGKITAVDRRNLRIYIENVATKKADETTQQVPIYASNVTIIGLNLDDDYRRRLLEEGREA